MYFGKLNKRQTEEIGTLKSPTKPLYLANQKLEELMARKKELEEVQDEKDILEKEIIDIKKEISQKEDEYKIVQSMDEIRQERKLEEEKINLYIREKNTKEEAKKEEQNKLAQIRPLRDKAKTHIALYIIPVLLIIVSIVLFQLKYTTIAIGGTLVSVIFALIITLNNLKHSNNYKHALKAIENQKNEIQTKIDLIEREIENKEQEIKDIKQKMNETINAKKQNLRINYPKAREEIFNEIISHNTLIENQNYINNLKISLNRKEIEKENITKNTENIIEIEEKLEQAKEILKELTEYNEAINLAKEALDSAYIEMKESITPKFTENLSNSINNITDGKYKTVKVNDENGLSLEMENRKLHIIKLFKQRNN